MFVYLLNWDSLSDDSWGWVSPDVSHDSAHLCDMITSPQAATGFAVVGDSHLLLVLMFMGSFPASWMRSAGDSHQRDFPRTCWVRGTVWAPYTHLLLPHIHSVRLMFAFLYLSEDENED